MRPEWAVRCAGWPARISVVVSPGRGRVVFAFGSAIVRNEVTGENKHFLPPVVHERLTGIRTRREAYKPRTSSPLPSFIKVISKELDLKAVRESFECNPPLVRRPRHFDVDPRRDGSIPHVLTVAKRLHSDHPCLTKQVNLRLFVARFEQDFIGMLANRRRTLVDGRRCTREH